MRLRGLAAALSISALLLSTAQASTQRTARYAVRDLGTLGGTTAAAIDVNALGTVVGASTTADGDLHAFRWAKGKMTNLGTLGGTSSYATAINDFGIVVGYSQLADGRTHAFLWRRGSGMRDLGTLGGDDSYAADVNDVGVVVGRALDGSQTPHGFVWTSRTGMRQLSGAPVSVAAAVGAGKEGPIGGSAGLPFVPGVWAKSRSQFSAILLPDGFDQGQAFGMDARGDTVGTIYTGGGATRGFFRSGKAGARALGVPDGFQSSEAYSVSNSLRIVGVAYDDPLAGTAGWMMRGARGRMRLLSDLVPGSGWQLASPSAVNDLGQVVGAGAHRGETRAFLLTPDRKERAASLRGFVLGGKGFHRRISKTLARALRDFSRGHKKRACSSLHKVGSAAGRERTLSKPVRKIFTADLRGFRGSITCSS